MEQTHTFGIILAGGIGARMGTSGGPKQFLSIDGESILARSVRAFEASPQIDIIVVVSAAGHLEATRQEVEGFSKVQNVVTGGATRSDSTRAGLAALPDQGLVLVHDAARPLVSEHLIAGCVRALQTGVAVTTAINSSDTVVVVDNDRVLDVPDRSRILRVQTPQGFRINVLKQAYERAARDEQFVATDDASVVRQYLPDLDVVVIPGDETNIKITTPLDLELAKVYLTAAQR